MCDDEPCCLSDVPASSGVPAFQHGAELCGGAASRRCARHIWDDRQCREGMPRDAGQRNHPHPGGRSASHHTRQGQVREFIILGLSLCFRMPAITEGGGDGWGGGGGSASWRFHFGGRVMI